MKYIDAEKLIAEIERRIRIKENLAQHPDMSDMKESLYNIIEAYKSLKSFIFSLQQEQPEVIGGVVHHALGNHWIVTDQKQLATALKAFPEGTEVELFIFARKEDIVI